jgi:peptidoglycan/xylan/chitin deacetylase (PgdA/CDA1 family)
MLISISFHAHNQGSDVINASICTWYQNKPGAVSVSFDDASYTQYASAYPILEKYGIKATFSVVGEWAFDEPTYTAEPDHFEIQKMGWPQFLELFNHGHELAAHGYYHERYDKFAAVPDLADEMKKIKTLIETRTNSRVFTLNYPYSFACGNIPEAAREAGFLFGRTGLDTINPPTPVNMYLLATNVILNTEQPDSTTFQNWLQQTKGNWLILMYHHLFPLNSKEMELIRLHNVAYSYSLPPESFEKQMQALITKNYWVAPISEVGKYIIERDNMEIRLIVCRNKIYICTLTNLDKQVYDRPLTLKVTVPWKRAAIKGSLNDGVFQILNNEIFIDVLPETELILTKD